MVAISLGLSAGSSLGTSEIEPGGLGNLLKISSCSVASAISALSASTLGGDGYRIGSWS